MHEIPSNEVINLRQIERTDQLIEALIRPSDEVVLIGPNKSLTMDASLLMVAHQMAKIGSIQNLWVVEPIYDTEKEIKRLSGSVVLGWGSYTTYTKELDALRELNLPLAMPKWTGKDSDMHRLLLPTPSTTVRRIIIDHNTSTFVTAGYAAAKPREAIAFFTRALQEYQDNLAQSGLILLMCRREELQFLGPDPIKKLKTLLEKMGFANVINFRLQEDLIRLKINQDLATSLKSIDHHETHPLRDMAHMIRESGSQIELRLQPEYASREVFLCIK